MSLKNAFLRGENARRHARTAPLTAHEKKTKRLHDTYNRHAQKLAKRLDRELSEIIAKNYGFTLAQIHPRFSRPRLDAFDASITYMLFKMDTAALPEKFNHDISEAEFLKPLQAICDAPHIDARVSPTWIHCGNGPGFHYEFGVEITPRAPRKVAPSV